MSSTVLVLSRISRPDSGSVQHTILSMPARTRSQPGQPPTTPSGAHGCTSGAAGSVPPHWVTAISMLLISESYVDLKSSRDRSQALRPRTNMYSRQGKHPQRVNGTPPGTPDPPSRPSALGRPPRAPMSDHTSRDRARQHSRRVRHAAHHRTRLRACESRAPGTNA